jgi:peptidyl-prolyl cis-trans isomerase D
MASKSRNILTKIVVFVLFGMLILSFVVWGVGDIVRTPSQVVAVAEVGDVQIDEREFRRTLSRELNRLSARLGTRLDADQARALGIVDQVLGQMVGRALFDQKAQELGMVVTKEQIGRRISQEPAFQNTLGEFDRNRFAQALQISNLGEQEYVDTLTRDIIRQQLADAVTGAIAVPRQLTEHLFRYQKERRVAQVITVPYSSITDLPEPDEPALEAIHKENAGQFMAPEMRRLTYIQLRAEDLAGEIKASESELREEYESRRDDFVIPELRKIEQIVVTDEAAVQQVEGKLKDGATFATVAQEVTGQPPIDLGEVRKDNLPQELADAAFAAAPNTVTAPIKSPLGWHVLKIDSVTPGREKGFDEVRDELAQEVGMRLAVDSMVSIANQLDDKLGAGATLEDATASLGLKLHHVDAVDRQGNGPDGEPIADLPGDQFLDVAFSTAVGTDSLLSETNDGGYFVLRTDAATEARLRPLIEVREQVVEVWRERQRAERAEARAQELAEKIRGGTSIEAVAAEAGLKVIATEGLTRFDSRAASNPAPTLPGKLFQLSTGEVTTVQAATGHAVARLEKIIPADPAASPEDMDDVRASVATALRGDMLEEFAASLRVRFGVTVNERLVETTLNNL